MDAAAVSRWVEIIRSIFPENTQITPTSSGESVWVKVRRKLGNDPLRPDKPAKGLNIYFTREFCKAYQGLDPAAQVNWDGKVREIIEANYAKFDPTHNVPHGASMPVESWFITTGLIG